MATTLYLRETTANVSGYVQTEKSTALPVGTVASGANGPWDLDTIAGSALANFERVAGPAITGHGDCYFGKWISPVLAVTSISANTWTFAFAASENSTNANSFVALSVYVLKADDTVRGYVYDSDTGLGTEWGTSAVGKVVTFSGSAVASVISTDRLVVEVWRHSATQGMATAYNQDLYFDGATAVSDGVGNANPATYLETPQDGLFGAAPGEHALAGDIALGIVLDGAETRETFVAGDITVPLALAGAIARDTFLAGDIDLPLALDGNIAVEILAHALAGDISLDIALDGSILRTTSLAGDISLPLELDGIVARTTFLSGDIALPILLDGAVARTTFLAGDIALPLLLDGAVEVAGVISLAGEIALEIVVDGAVTRTTSLAGDIVFAPSLDGALMRGTFISGDIALPILLDGSIAVAGEVVAGTVAVIDLTTGAAVAIIDLDGDSSVSVQDVSSGAAGVTIIDLTP